MKKLLTIFILFFIVSQVNAEEINSSQAENIDGIIYKIGNENPFSGKINTYRDDKLILAADFKLGRLNGKYEEYFNDQSIKKSAYYFNGKLSGEYIEYYKSGSTKLQTYFREGERFGITRTFYPNENLKSLKTYYKGKLRGEFKEFSIDGAPLKKGYFRNSLEGHISDTACQGGEDEELH